MKPIKLVNVITLLVLQLIIINCTRKAENIEFQNTGKLIDASNSIIEKDTVWKDLFGGDTIDYYVTALVRVKNAVLTIKPGVKISFEDSISGIRVEGSGGLRAEGTVNSKIMFTTRNLNKIYWLGIIFASNSSQNILSNVLIEGAGGKIDEGFCEKPTAIGMAKNVNAKATITNCSIKSNNYGLWAAPSGDVNFKFQRNELFNSIAVSADNMGSIDSTNHFPYYCRIEVYGTASEIKDADTIKNPGIPFQINGKVFVAKNLIISPGCTFEFAKTGELITSDISGNNHTGTIKAIGTSAKRIIFKGLPKPSGVINPDTSWVGITLTSNNDNEFRYCNISNAGNAPAFSNPANAKGNFIVGRTGVGAKAIIMYCNISNGLAYGITKYSGSSINTKHYDFLTKTWIESNQYAQNKLGEIGSY